MKSKLMLCAVRILSVLFLFVLLVFTSKYLGFNRGDLETTLLLMNKYFVEFVALIMYGAVAVIFYRASINEKNSFHFVNFFKTGPGIEEDPYKLGYFLLLLTVIWSIFALFWREKLTTEYVGVVLGVFVVKASVDSIGKAFGKYPPPPLEQLK